MAQISTVPTANSVPGGRIAAGARNVADVRGGPVEASSPQVGVTFDEAAFLYQSGGRYSPPPNDEAAPRNSVSFGPPSQTFAAMFELHQSVERRAGDPTRRDARGLADLRARAINTYLTNSKVVHGEKDVRGESLNLNL